MSVTGKKTIANRNTVVILTSNYDAGILQFAVQMKKEFNKLFNRVILFVPSIADCDGHDIESYLRKNSINPFSLQYHRIARRIMELGPDLVFVCDTNLITSRIAVALKKSIPVYTVVHDVDAHPHYGSFFSTIKSVLKKPYINIALQKCDRVVMLSKNSLDVFARKNPKMAGKCVMLRLGAHVPDTEEEKPQEVDEGNQYILFFGRMDKYKGIINLLQAYEIKKEEISQKIVIAGKGTLTSEEQSIISKYPKTITLLKRYISDGEMIWLFKHASCTVLPYIEASQSGVLSMSYRFGKPVIVSDLQGLTEFVQDEKTGFVFHSLENLAELLITVPLKSETMKEDISRYYVRELDWSNNLERILNE